MHIILCLLSFIFVIVSAQNGTLKAAVPAAPTLDTYQLTGCLIACPRGYTCQRGRCIVKPQVPITTTLSSPSGINTQSGKGPLPTLAPQPGTTVPSQAPPLNLWSVLGVNLASSATANANAYPTGPIKPVPSVAAKPSPYADVSEGTKGTFGLGLIVLLFLGFAL